MPVLAIIPDTPSSEFDGVASHLHLRSSRCSGSTFTEGSGCTSCRGLGPSINIVNVVGIGIISHRPVARLNYDQLLDKLDTRLNLVKSFQRARNRNTESRRLLDLISTSDVPGLSRILSTAKKQGWGLSKTHDYCRHMIANTRRELSLRVTTGKVKMLMLLKNIETLFKDVECDDEFPQVIHTLCQDEIAGDGRLCYLEKTDDIGGLCEHAIIELETQKMGSDLTSIQAAVKAIREDRVHIGKEFSVAAIARHSGTDYGAKPVLLMPTCKQSSWQAGAQILQKLLLAWKISPHGEKKHGPIKSLSSDGCPKRRLALYLLCMHQELKEGDPLFSLLGDLAGLNLFTGKDGITLDPDIKHILKRLCKALCSKIGVMVGDVTINIHLLPQWLERLSGHDWSEESIHSLLNPKDPQDVPRAVKLLCLIADLRDLDSTDFYPFRKTHTTALSVFSARQYTAFLPISHAPSIFGTRRAFFPGNFTGDLQCLVKNLIFKIAHTKVLNPLLKIFLCLLGDDVLELHYALMPYFAVTRSWKRHARRLNFNRSRDVDHISPRLCTGELTAGSCDIKKCYDEGQDAAKAFLESFGISIDFKTRFSQKGFDLMRPSDIDAGDPVDPAEELDLDSIDPAAILGLDPAAILAVEQEEMQVRSGNPHSPWIKLDDEGRKLAHKKTVIRMFMDPTMDIDSRRSHDRLLRVRYYSIGGDHWDRTTLTALSLNVGDNHLLQIGLPLLYFCAPESSLTAKNPPTYLDSAPIAELALSGSKYEITGQILSLKPYLDNSDNLYGAWTLDFAAFHSGKSKRANLLNPVARMRHLTVTVSGQLVVSLPRDSLTSTSRSSLPDSNRGGAEPQLADAESKLKARVKDNEVRLKIPVFGYVKSGDFPYEYHAPRTCPGAVSVSHGSVPVKAPPPKDPRKPCRICNKNILASERQNHMGGHILLSLQATADAATEECFSPFNSVGADYPCGFCGQSMPTSACTIGIVGGKRKFIMPRGIFFPGFQCIVIQRR
ncbi:hypothetical protein B0H14DRAFT_3698037 [Mycena olivaceomarginata]|nr:hypothetical protein B0H14DRAFT_3698037 [Mycena olivaceomarginata]